MRAVVPVVVAFVLAGCGGNDEGDEAAATTAATAPSAAAGNGCRNVEQPKPRQGGTLKAPAALLNVDRTYRLTFHTSCGEFTVGLTPKTAPKTAASFVALARADFFDGTFFHRIVPGFVIQGGDPTGTGMGGPGYSTVDTPAAGTTYTRGVVAMAKTAAEPPGTAGSQFFIVTGADIGLPPDYAVIGKVVKGLDVVTRIGALGNPNTEFPTEPVVIDDVVVHAS
jgi:peptidyl-prolyl cis-trans isomerase B (cyclophilin B)